ncbi:MAG: hypothetical protein ACI9HK_001261 [Pirellulaceae bacterium]|jgi:hypothetical protein
MAKSKDLLLFVLAAFSKAYCRHLIGWTTVALSAGVYVLAAVACFVVPDIPLENRLICAALTALPLARLATAPLALSWNRHR